MAVVVAAVVILEVVHLPRCVRLRIDGVRTAVRWRVPCLSTAADRWETSPAPAGSFRSQICAKAKSQTKTKSMENSDRNALQSASNLVQVEVSVACVVQA